MDSAATISLGIDAAVACGADAAQLRAVVDQATATAHDDRSRFRLAIVYPALVAGLAIVGMLWTIPTNHRLIMGLEDSFLEPPIPPEHVAWSSITSADLGLAALGLLAGGGLAAWTLRRGCRDDRHAATAARCDLLAELAGCDCPPAARGRIADEILAGLDDAAPSTPPLVFLAESQADIDQRAALLRTTASFYRSLAERRRRRMQRLVPIVGSLFAGIAVLGYGLALFRPMARLLDTLAVAHHQIGEPAPIVPEGQP